MGLLFGRASRAEVPLKIERGVGGRLEDSENKERTFYQPT